MANHDSEMTDRIPRSLYWAMVLQFAVGGAVMPFITILFRDRGLDFGQISRIFMASSGTMLVFPFLWGMLADRYISMNRLFAVLNALVLVALGLLTLMQSFAGVLFSFMLFYACFHPTLILINALCFHHLSNPREQFAGLRAWGSVGWIVPSVCIYLWLVIFNTENMEIVLKLGALLTVVMFTATWFLPDTPPGARRADEAHLVGIGYWRALKQLLSDWNYLTIIVAFFLIAASFSILVYYSPPHLEDIGVPRKWIGPIQCIGVVLEIVTFPFLPRFIRRWGFTASMGIGCGALVLRQLLFAWSENPWLLSSSYLLAGAVIVFYHIGASIWVNTVASREVRATAQTLLVLFGSGLGPTFANAVAGRLASSAGQDLKSTFLFAALLAGLAAILIMARGSRLNHRPDPQPGASPKPS